MLSQPIQNNDLPPRETARSSGARSKHINRPKKKKRKKKQLSPFSDSKTFFNSFSSKTSSASPRESLKTPESPIMSKKVDYFANLRIAQYGVSKSHKAIWSLVDTGRITAVNIMSDDDIGEVSSVDVIVLDLTRVKKDEAVTRLHEFAVNQQATFTVADVRWLRSCLKVQKLLPYGQWKIDVPKEYEVMYPAVDESAKRVAVVDADEDDSVFWNAKDKNPALAEFAKQYMRHATTNGDYYMQLVRDEHIAPERLRLIAPKRQPYMYLSDEEAAIEIENQRQLLNASLTETDRYHIDYVRKRTHAYLQGCDPQKDGSSQYLRKGELVSDFTLFLHGFESYLKSLKTVGKSEKHFRTSGTMAFMRSLEIIIQRHYFALNTLSGFLELCSFLDGEESVTFSTRTHFKMQYLFFKILFLGEFFSRADGVMNGMNVDITRTISETNPKNNICFGFNQIVSFYNGAPPAVCAELNAQVMEAFSVVKCDQDLAEAVQITAYTTKILSESQRHHVEELAGVHGISVETAAELVLHKGLTLTKLEQNPLLLDRKIPQLDLALSYVRQYSQRMPRAEVERIFNIVKTACDNLPAFSYSDDFELVLCGSYARGYKTCGDVDILLVVPETWDLGSSPVLLFDLVRELNSSGHIVGCLSGEESAKKWMGLVRTSENALARRLDLLVVRKSEKALATLHFIGPERFNRSLRWLARKYNLSLSQHNMRFRGTASEGADANGIPLLIRKEEDVFKYLGLEYVEAHMRESASVKK
ncbi:hypothetical protein PCE1_001663 [Barthelona sp. PCE]